MTMPETTKGWKPRTKQRLGYEITGEKGDAGEDHVWDFCERQGWEYEKYYDINSQVNLKIDGKINGQLVDIKTNMFMDTWHAIELDKYEKGDELGWFNTSKADEIWAVNLETQKVYLYSIETMRDNVETIIKNNPHRHKRLSKKANNRAWGVYIDFAYTKWKYYEGPLDMRDEKIIEEDRKKRDEFLRKIINNDTQGR